MALRRDSSEATRQKDVAPGDKTGTYYITLCNLPFGTSWQELKDFTRTACEVDHVEVFRTSTSGWVRVNGRANFDKAWQLLNGGHFNGRSIIASDRNKSHPIKIKELVDGSPDTAAPGQLFMQQRSAMSPPTLATCGQQDKTRLGAYPYAQLVNHGDRPVMLSDYGTSESISPPGDSSTEWDTFSHHETYGGPCDHYRVPWEHGMQYGVAEQYPDPSVETSAQYDTSTYFPTNEHRIVVTGFPRKASSDDVASWIRMALGQHSSFISRIDGPVNYSKTAYVTLASSSMLRPGIEALNYRKYQDRTIKAKMARENMYSSDAEGKISTGGPKSSKRARPPLSKSKTSSSTFNKGSSSMRTKSSGNRQTDRSRSVGGVLIVDGTTDQGTSAPRQ